MMLHIPQVLSTAEVAQMHTRLKSHAWVDGRNTVGEQGAKVKNNWQLEELSPLGQELGELIVSRLLVHPLFFSAALPLRVVPPLFNRYGPGQSYGLHVDGAVRTVPVSRQALRTDLSCTLFLSEPDSYEGGELEVVDTYGSHEAKLPAGDLLLYPSSSLHRVHPIRSGERICAFFWVQSMVRTDTQRSLLFEMDQNIQKLRSRLGDCAETVALTGTYHNLLRMWAEV